MTRRSIWRYSLLAALVAGHTAVAADRARQAEAEGRKAYEAGRFNDAAAAFQRAAAQAEPARLDPSVAYYNTGNTLYRAKLYKEAEESYAKALITPDHELQIDNRFNLGNAFYRHAEELRQSQQLDQAKDLITKALDKYKEVLTLSPTNNDAKTNFELAQKKLKDIEKQKREQPQQQQPSDDQQKKGQQQKPEQSKDQQQQNQQKQQDQQKQPDQQQSPKPDPSQPSQSSPQQGQPDKDKQPAPAAGDQKKDAMTPEEARMLLDTMKQDEKSRREQLRVMHGEPTPVQQDW